jgi:hypothetical protein
LFAKVLGRRVVISQAHAVVVLPRFAFVAADHSSLRLFFLFIETADAAYVGVFFVIIGFCLGLGFGAFAFALARSTLLFTDVSVFRVLAFGCPSRAAGFVCKEDVVSFIVPQANTFVRGTLNDSSLVAYQPWRHDVQRRAIIYSAIMKQN